MGRFTAEDRDILVGATPEALLTSVALQALRDRMHDLHQAIASQLRLHNFDLHIMHEKESVTVNSVATVETTETLSVQYLRPKGQAMNVERLMGREEVASLHNVQARFHPVIEVRLIPDHLCVELLVAPDAWFDQQNFIGKLNVPRHRSTFYTLLRDFDEHYCTGFWRGTHLSNMHLTAPQFQHPRIMNEWLSTFETSLDWLRLGIWYDYDDQRIADDQIETTIVHNIRALYDVYQFILWHADNDYRAFYNADDV